MGRDDGGTDAGREALFGTLLASVGRLRRVIVIAATAGVGLATGLCALWVSVGFLVHHGGSASAADLSAFASVESQRSVVYADDGQTVLATLQVENRSPVAIDQVPPILQNAVLDVEDARFWTHGGVDLPSTVRALAANVQQGTVSEGGSTIAQQLVKNAVLTPERNLDRKVREAIIASRLEGKFTKQQILAMYLNTVYFGNGAYGVQAAAETYFNEDVSRVTAGQAALLAGIIRDPQDYDPIRNPRQASARRSYVLDRMVGQGHLSRVQADDIKTSPLPSSVTVPASANTDDYFVEEVKQRLLLPGSPLGSTYTARYNALFRGGLKIYTTLDPRLQQLAEEKVRSDIPANRQGFTGALVSVDSATGKVRALVGGPGFDKFKFDLATQAVRQPGSSFKLFTLLAAYENGYSPYDSVNGSSPCPLRFPDYVFNPNEVMHNDEGQSSGTVNLMSATANSINCAYLRLAHEVGLPKVVEMAHRLGVGQRKDLGEDLKAWPSTVIGADEVTVLEMAGAYATLADDGVYRAPTFVDRIEDPGGKVIYKGGDPGRRVISEQVSRTAVMTLRAVVQYGTGVAANLPDRQVAGKTGTTERNTDAWFDGITPQLTTVVWMGDPKAKTPMFDVGGIAVYGGTYPARIWHDFMAGALAGLSPVTFPPPDYGKIPAGRYLYSPALALDSGYGYYYNPYYYPYGSSAPRPTSPRRSTPSTTTGTPASAPPSLPAPTTPPAVTEPPTTPPPSPPPSPPPPTTAATTAPTTTVKQG